MRTVQCISHDASGPRVVEDAVCAPSAAAPPSVRSCNVHRCAEYRVTGWSAVSELYAPVQVLMYLPVSKISQTRDIDFI